MITATTPAQPRQDVPTSSFPEERLAGYGERPPQVIIAGRRLSPTVVFDTYWTFAAARQGIYEARIAGLPGPWTQDPILSAHRFTNCYRAADRVSQYLITHVSYGGDQSIEEVFFRTLLFKIFNKISTWELLTASLGTPTWKTYSFDRYNTVLSEAFARKQRLYSAAYVVPPPSLGEERKHSNHLRLLEMLMRTGVPLQVRDVNSMQAAFQLLRGYPAIGDFLAYQYLIDLNYSAAYDYGEMEFVVPGPGARDGIRKCFGVAATGIEADIIRYMADHQDEHFQRLGLRFRGLRGRPLQLIDCQNLFCEVDKYARVAHPDVAGLSGRTRIKQRFQAVTDAVPAWFPPKWGINGSSPAWS
ncbi:nucleotide kinase domain-containing protein [Actinoplanes sp. NPDC020271]|uniref:nucleotide kinase domain-containing protein n=1 Tax=Actinoplanes sp. NPDC020271 TaxID=3363896 RepID=UPI0037876199